MNFLIQSLRRYSIGNYPSRLNFTLGQALYESRPNLIKPGDLTPGISAQEYYIRRLRLADKLPAKSCVVIPSNEVKHASGPVFYKFQQNTNFLYLTGFDGPDSMMILEKPTENLDDTVLHMLVREKDERQEKWTGHRTGTENCYNFFNADEVVGVSQWKSYFNKVLSKYDNIYFNSDSIAYQNDNVQSFLTKDLQKNVKSFSREIAELRLIKSESEMKIIRECGRISGRSYNEAMVEKIQSEKNLQAFLEYKFISNGLDGSGYIPVVAGGPNALTIHYTINNDIIRDDEMVLIDAGGKFGHYTADISRTFPILGKFSEPQKALYEAVLDVNRECIKITSELVSGGVSFSDLHNFSRQLLYQNLNQVGGFKNLEKNIDKLYPHHIGHYLGLDLHDIPAISMAEKFKENSVLTIEPGVYCPPDDSFVPKHFQNIGIRVEDNISLLPNGQYENLTVEAVKEVDDIEALIAKGSVNKKYVSSITEPLL